MAFEADALIDRRRLSTRLSRWRAAALAALVAAGLAAFGRFDAFPDRAYVARYDVSGVIVDDRRRHAALAGVAGDEDAKALIVHVNSPGGTVVGGEALHRALRRVADAKPVVAVMGEVAASAAYMAAIAADHVLARDATITGSIGVVMRTADISGLLEKLGIAAESIKSGPLKDAPSPLEPMTEAARAALREAIEDSHAMFLDMVAERRGLSGAALARVEDGRIFTGRRALGAGLIDGIGGEEEAVGWLDAERGIPPRLPKRDVGRRPEFDLLARLTSWIGEKTALSERFTLDGLVALWHPWQR